MKVHSRSEGLRAKKFDEKRIVSSLKPMSSQVPTREEYTIRQTKISIELLPDTNSLERGLKRLMPAKTGSLAYLQDPCLSRSAARRRNDLQVHLLESCISSCLTTHSSNFILSTLFPVRTVARSNCLFQPSVDSYCSRRIPLGSQNAGMIPVNPC